MDKIDPECGKFIIVDNIAFEQKDFKDILIITKSQKVALIKNYDPNWIYMEITSAFFSKDQFAIMETYKGPSFHIYIVDYDKDGYLDIVLPNIVNNTLVYLRNPGSAYWRKVGQAVYQSNK